MTRKLRSLWPLLRVLLLLNLTYIPVVYLLDRSNWVDFKRALNECATWNFPAWMTTIVYKGKEWNEMAVKGTDLTQYFSAANKKAAGDGVSSNISGLADKLVGLLDLPRNVARSKTSCPPKILVLVGTWPPWSQTRSGTILYLVDEVHDMISSTYSKDCVSMTNWKQLSNLISNHKRTLFSLIMLNCARL